MAYEPSNHAQQQRSNLDYLFHALGIDELYERVAELDGGEGGPKEVPENPTNNPMVQKNLEGVGTLSGGPTEENEVILEDVKPEDEETDKDTKSEEKSEEKKTTTTTEVKKPTPSSPRSTSTTAKK